MNIITRILSFLEFDPDRDGLPGTKADKASVAGGRTNLPEDVRPIAGGRVLFKTDKDKDGTGDWDRFDKAGRTYELTKADKEEIRLSKDKAVKLSEEKYLLFKYKWSLGVSALDASLALSAEQGKGYGKRTAETYFAAINRAYNAPPIVQKKGGDRKTPQPKQTFLQKVEY